MAVKAVTNSADEPTRWAWAKKLPERVMVNSSKNFFIMALIGRKGSVKLRSEGVEKLGKPGLGKT
ncbi:hypothetical protein GCM10027190_59650 [Spirosoma areae]